MTGVYYSAMWDDSDRAQRWQKIAMEQLGFTVNLFLTYTIAALAFWFALLRDEEFHPAHSAKCMMIYSLVALVVAALCGCGCTFNRLSDFRGTAARARNDESKPSKEWLDFLGKVTWVLLRVQVLTFTIGTVLLGASLILTFGCKLTQK